MALAIKHSWHRAGLPFWLSIGVLAIVAVILWGYTRRRHLMDVDDSDFLQPRAVRDKFRSHSQYFLWHSCLLLLTFNRSFYSLGICRDRMSGEFASHHAPGQQHDTPFRLSWWRRIIAINRRRSMRRLRQQGLTAIHFIPQLAAGDAALWGEFLCAVFHRWVREDNGRINILLFSETLSAWCGETLTQPGAPAANSTCYGCPWLRLCRCGEQEDPLCAGYRQFYDFSGPLCSDAGPAATAGGRQRR